MLVMAAVATAVLVLTAVSVWQETEQYADAKRQLLVATAQVFALAAGPAAATDDPTAAYAAMRAIGRIPNLASARIETRDGRVLASIGVATQLDSDLRIDVETSHVSPLAVLASRSIEVSVPIIDSGETVGRFVLVSTTADLLDRLVGLLPMTMIAVGLAVMISLLVAWRLQRGITQPLRLVTQTIADIRRGHDYQARVKATSDDEVGLLVDDFNCMLGEIQDRDARLAVHRHSLEQEVTDRTRELRVAKDAAEGANAAKSTFLATMSHEIRTPMNGIMVMAELLAAGEMPDRQRRYAEVIVKSGQSLLAIINDILDLSKIEAGKLELEAVELDLAELAEDVTNLFAEHARANDVDLAACVAPDVPRRIVGDPVRLNQVIGNLVNNALKFTESGFVLLSISLDPEDSTRLRFTVSDSGIGIPSEKLDVIFGAFSQQDQSTTRRFGGTGLGLAICKRLVAAMGGEITADSTPGRGSTFAFSIPRGEVATEPAWPRIPDVGGAAAIAIVAVAGEATRFALDRYLTAAGCRITFVEDRPRAVNFADAALVVADAAWVVSQPPASAAIARPVVLCLGTLGDPTADRLVVDGHAAAVIARPLIRSEIEAALARVAAGEAPDRKPSSRADELQGVPRFPGLRVLVADDSAVNREVAIEALARLDVAAEVVVDGRRAVEMLAEHAFDAVLMDVSMPEMDGFEATRHIRAAEQMKGTSRVSIIALTADVVGTAADEWHRAGMDAVLHKPFTIRALADCLAQFVSIETIGRPGPRVAEPASVPVTVAPQGDATLPVLDSSVMQQLEAMAANGREHFVERVFALYREHAPKAAAQLGQAVETGDAEAVARAAHALKSMSYNIGASRVSSIAADLDHGARTGALPITPADLDRLSTALRETYEAIEGRMQCGEAGTALLAADADDKVGTAPVEDAATAARRALARDLRIAITRQDDLWLAYQPLVDRTGSATVGAEALVRWNRPGYGQLLPGAFVPIAEETGDIVALGEWVLRRACRDAVDWPGITIAVNVSSIQVRRPDFADAVVAILADTGFDPNRLELEITETALLGYEDRTVAAMRRLREQGITFSLDDFGTGYASLVYLRRFPFNKIKIDRSFVASVQTAVDAAAIVHAITSIGRSLGMKVVAEGVELAEQHRFLSAAGVHVLQGYLFGRPMPAAALTARLASEAAAGLQSRTG